MSPDHSRAAVEERLRDLAGVVVAYSGGVDSTLMAALAVQTLGRRAVAVTAVSPALAQGELSAARRVASEIGIEHHTVATHELAREGYRANGPDRCFHCKDALYTALGELGSSWGIGSVVSGANLDDLGDWRPGLRAASDHGVVHPLVEAGIDKAGVRLMALDLQLPNAEKVASPCLASRVPYGRQVTPQVLHRIDAAEAGVHALGFPEIRVRDFGELGRLEVAERDLVRAQQPDQHPRLMAAIVAAGYEHAELSGVPLRSGSLNDALDLPVLGVERASIRSALVEPAAGGG